MLWNMWVILVGKGYRGSRYSVRVSSNHEQLFCIRSSKRCIRFVPAPSRYMPAYRLRHAAPVVMHCLRYCSRPKEERDTFDVEVEVGVREKGIDESIRVVVAGVCCNRLN